MRILLAVDDSAYSSAAMESVAERPWPPDTTVRVLTAVEKFVPPLSDLIPAGGRLETVEPELANVAERLVSRLAASLRSRGLRVESAVRHGDPRSVIVDEAKAWAADLIVLGAQMHPLSPLVAVRGMLDLVFSPDESWHIAA